MASKRTARPSANAADESVEACLAAMKHPHEKGVRALRRAILGAAPAHRASGHRRAAPCPPAVG